MNQSWLKECDDIIIISYCNRVVVAMVTHIHEQLCVVEHRVESLLSEVAAGRCQVAMPQFQR